MPDEDENDKTEKELKEALAAKASAKRLADIGKTIKPSSKNGKKP